MICSNTIENEKPLTKENYSYKKSITNRNTAKSLPKNSNKLIFKQSPDNKSKAQKVIFKRQGKSYI